jgi:8-oxo-dGTP diphosphatase
MLKSETKTKRFFVCVKGLVFNDKNQFLLIRRSKNDCVKPGCWEFSGGRLEFGETAEGALVREIYEETGLIVSCVSVINLWSCLWNKRSQLIGVNYLCITKDSKVALSCEHDKSNWLSLDKLDKIFNSYNIYNGLLEDMKGWNWKDFLDKIVKYRLCKM